MLKEYEKCFEESLIDSYIETFAGEPWNEIWEREWVLERVRWVSEVPHFKGFVALEGDTVVGALLGYSKPFKARLDFEILELFVLPTHQGKGVGKSLVKELHQSLSKGKYGVVHLLTARETSPEEFYKSIGYERDDKLCFMVHRF